MPTPLSAVNAISPAFALTKQELFNPFRPAFWARMALVAAATGEFYGCGGFNGSNYTAPTHSSKAHRPILTFAGPDLSRLHQFLWHYLPWVVLGALLLFAGAIFWLYVSSVFRFILFNSVLTSRCWIKEEWRRWRSQGFRFLLWRISFALVSLLMFAILAGAGVLVVVTTGAFRAPRQHVAFLVLVGFVFIVVLVALMLLLALVGVFAKDFLVPVMALEGVGVMDGWRRVARMINAEKSAYAGYVLMKIVLAVGSTIIFGILTLIALVVMLIPISIAGYGAYFYARSAGLFLNPVAVAAGVLLGFMALALIIYVAAVISTPPMVFFQAYIIHFLGLRYSPLAERIAPPPEPPPLPKAEAPLPVAT